MTLRTSNPGKERREDEIRTCHRAEGGGGRSQDAGVAVLLPRLARAHHGWTWTRASGGCLMLRPDMVGQAVMSFGLWVSGNVATVS